MIFVTGGTGLVGAHLLYKLAKSGANVKALKRSTSNLNQVLKTFYYYSSSAKELFDRIEWVEGDILDYFGLEELLNGVDEVFHCAAIVSFHSNERKTMINNNVEGTSNLVDAALFNNVKKFCHISSIASLGRTKYGIPVTEETSWVPSKKNSAYSESKFFSEAEIWRGIQEGLNAVIVNPSIILGPGNWESGSPKLFKTIWNGLKFYTTGVTGYVDVNDVTKAILELMSDQYFHKFKNQRFILNSENKSYQEIFYSIANELDKPRPKYRASDFLLGVAWRLVSLGSVFTNKPSMVTREAVSNSNAKSYFDGSKIVQNIKNFNYISIQESIKKTSAILIDEMKK
jgi:nucleoside-diphosphate-sugar epimerase